MSNDQDLFTTDEAAAYVGLAAQTLNRWRCEGRHLKFLRLGRVIRYRKCDLDEFIKKSVVNVGESIGK